jgi:hypothetical protein
MIKYIRKNNKKVLALFSAALMVAFAAQTRYGSPGGGNRGNTVIGHIGTAIVTEGDLDSAHQQWRLLRQAMVVEYPPQSGQYQSFVALAFQPTQTIDQDPTLYLLLLQEAQKRGIEVSEQDVQNFLTRQQILIQMPSGSVAQFDQIQSVDPDYYIDIREAIAGFLRVEQASGQAIDLCKFSRPLKDLELAENHQNITVRTVTFGANKLSGKIPAATPQDLHKQFEQFADVAPSGMASENNPLGFGYKIPDQAKVETIAVSRRMLKDAVLRTKSSYDWEVLARGYYLKHQAEFPATQPIAPPAIAMVTLPTRQPLSTTRPFEQVSAEIMDKVMGPDVDALSDRVQKSIAATLAKDWASYHAANPATQPTTDPGAGVGVSVGAASASMATSQPAVSSLGVPYDSYAYLTALAAKVQKDFDLLPKSEEDNKPMTVPELAKLPGVGAAHIIDAPTMFASAAMDRSLAILQPSAPLKNDEDSTIFFFRVTERIPAHAPASMTDIAGTVATDWLKSEQYQSAVDQAKALRDAAAKTGLVSAAAAVGQGVTTTPPFSADLEKGNDPVIGVPLTGNDIMLFREKCQSIVDAAAKHEPPVTVVESPNESKAVVIELADVQTDWPKGEKYVAEAQVTQELMSEFGRPLATEWFTLPSVEARLGFVDAQKKKGAG